MAQSFDPEAYRKIVNATERLRDGAIAQLPKAIDVVVDQAKESGSPVLIQHATSAAEEGVPAFVKLYNEFLDCCDQYTQKSKQIMDAMGIEA